MSEGKVFLRPELMHPPRTCGMPTGMCLCRRCVHSQPHAHTKANWADRIISAQCFPKQPHARCPGTPNSGMRLTVILQSTRERATFLWSSSLGQIKMIFKCITTKKQEPPILGWCAQLYVPPFPSPGREPQPPWSSILLSLQLASPPLQPRYADSVRLCYEAPGE